MLLPEELPPPPRTVRLKFGTYIGRTLVWLAVLFFFVVAPLSVPGRIARLRTLMDSGKTFKGSVVSQHMSGGGGRGGGRSHAVFDVEYEVNGNSYVDSVQDDVFYKYGTPGYVTVRAMSDNPGDSEVGVIDERRIHDTKMVWFLTLLVFCPIFGLACVFLELGIRREFRLLSIGEAVAGEVTLSRFSIINRSYTVVEYRYQTQSGEHGGSAWIMGSRIGQYPAKAPILVVYDPNKDASSTLPAFAHYCLLA